MSPRWPSPDGRAGKSDLNKDARIQYRNLVKQQALVGLYNRRGAVRFRGNILDEQAQAQIESFRDGQFTMEDAQRVGQVLAAGDNDALQNVAEKMMDQQAAAERVVSAIQVGIPEHGRVLRFRRALQIDPASPITVSFKSVSPRVTGWLRTLWPFAALWLVLQAAAALVRRGRRAA